MVIHGLQKMTLLDYPGKVAATVFLGGCDFRCPFCHNSGLLDAGAPGIMDDIELLKFLESRRGFLDGVCLTGGEPLLRKDLPDLLSRIRGLGLAVKLDTNGSHPDALRSIAEAGLADYIAMDIKNSFDRYGATCGLPGLDTAPIRESIAYLLQGPADYEFRTTVVKDFHNEASFRAIGPAIRGARRYYLQCFVDRGSVLQPGLSAPSREELERYAALVRPFVSRVEIRGI